jgi:riboflavin synthase
MFTGIIEQVGTVKTIERAEEHVNITIETTDWMMTDLVAGGSLSINGACLTVIATSGNTATFNIVYETMRKTSLGHMAEGDLVNLERAMPATGRFNGHIVQGHVDATGSIASIRQLDNSYQIYIDVNRDLMRYIVRKGSICVDGISWTVVDAEDKTFSVAIIPHTWENTSLSSKRAGDPVNIETDVIAKYVERMTESGAYSTTPLVMTGQSGFEGSQSRPFRDDMLRDTQFEMGEASRTYKLMEETGTQTAG